MSDQGDAAGSGEEGWQEVKQKPRHKGPRRSSGEASADPWSNYVSGNQQARPPLHKPGGTSGGPFQPGDRKALERQVYVEGLTSATTSEELKAAFRHCGLVEQAKVTREEWGESRGFGVVMFTDAASAAMAARDSGVRIDGKLCSVRMARPRAEGGKPQQTALTDEYRDAKEQVKDFITRHEVAGGAQHALFRADPKMALRALRAIESMGQGFTDSQIHSELQKVTRHYLSRELEDRVSQWVASTNLGPQWREGVQSVLVAQRSEDIEHILEIGRSSWFQRELCMKMNPSTWLLAQVHRHKRQQIAGDIQTFCARFGFDLQTERDLSELSAERARRMMQQWNPAGPGSQKQLQQRFVHDLQHAVAEHRSFKEQRERQKRQQEGSAVASHARIIQEWSDDEDDEMDYGNLPKPRQQDDFYAFDMNSEVPEPKASHNASSSAEQFVIHSETQSQSRASGARVGKRQPKPTHFVICVDTSGSMATRDCTGEHGGSVSRLDAVLETVNLFIASTMMHSADIYSFVSFNEESALHFSCLKAFDASVAVRALQIAAQKQTFYAMGIRGIEAAIRRDANRLPAHVVFLSDGEPTDPGSYNRDLHILRRKHTGNALRIYTVGFGESAKVNSREEDFIYLQQLASVGRGHFQRCGASLSSLQGAFTAVTSSITHTRSSVSASAKRRSSAWSAGGTGTRGSAEQRESAVSAGGREEGRASTTLPVTIDESGSEESDGEASEAESDRGQAMNKVNGNQIEFELPHPAQIFRNTDDPLSWRHFMAARTSFKFDGRHFSRSAAVQRVFLRRKPFMQGGMRLVYGMVPEHGAKEPDLVDNMMCAKRLFQDLEKDRGFQAHAAFCKSTAVASFFAKAFRQATERVGQGVTFGFLDCHLYSPVGANEDGYHFCGEAWLKGHFVKLNSNNGFVNESDYSEHTEIAQTFSHFTFDRSHGELMVVDLQGICGGDVGSPLYFLLTDPQVHSRGMYERFGAGDLSDQGICAFFQKHKCNDLCRKLMLRKEFDLRAPTHVLPMPGVPECIKALHAKDGQQFMQRMRQQCRISSLTVPREAHKEWVDIRIWAAARGGEKAIQQLTKRLEQYYESARKVVPVKPVPNWDIAQWQAQLEKWRKWSSQTYIIAFPSDWQHRGGVSELWVFAKHLGGNYFEWKDQQDACNQIQKTLEGAQHRQVSSQTSQAAAGEEETWTKYQDNNKQKYWYREPDGLWFYETDPDWQRFYDEASGCHWWWNNVTANWFYEPKK